MINVTLLLLQKHMKEHHEEVRERPCPHPGCNKVFTIDRYLQRHIKAIHTGGGHWRGTWVVFQRRFFNVIEISEACLVLLE